MLLRPVNIGEIEEVARCANPNRVPRPDGFNAHFYKMCWPIIGNDVCEAIMDFFVVWFYVKSSQRNFHSFGA